MKTGRAHAVFVAALFIFHGAGSSERAWAFEPERPVPPLSQPSIDRTGLLQAADRALMGHRLVEAEELLDRLGEGGDDIDRDSVKLLRAEWLIAVDRPADALPLLTSIGGGVQQLCRILSAKAVALLQLEALDRADGVLAGRGPRCASEPVFWRSLGRVNLARDRADDAIVALRAAIALEPGNDAIRGDLAVALIAAGEPAEAAHTLSDLLQRSPDQFDVRINLDFANGMMGQKPVRRASDDAMLWSRRLQYAGLGARQAGHPVLAEALLAQALIERPRHDEQLWRQYEEVSGGKGQGADLDSH